jgi:hypothetical protein
MQRRTAAAAQPVLALLALTAVMAGCNSDEPPASNTDQRPAAVSTAIKVWTAIKDCPVTYPSDKPPVEGKNFNYGDRHLAVFLWPRGRVVTEPLPDGSRWAELRPDGSVVANKVGWWRGAAGRLTIQGERLDAPAPPLRAWVPPGYGSTGFQVTQLTFPTRGCWKVVGSVRGHDITFVVRVTKRRD